MKILDWFDSLWFVWWGLFAIFEGLGLWYEHTNHTDENTLTHVVCVVLPVPYRILIIVWLFFHFVIQHSGRS